MTIQIARSLSNGQRHLTLVRKGAPPRKPPSKTVRPRKYLNLQEVKSVAIAALMTGRHRERDYALVLMGYRHAMRVSELVSVEWGQIDLDAGLFHVNRNKGGNEGVHTMTPDMVKALRALPQNGKYVFASERGGHISENACHKIIASLGRVAGIPFPIHPHMLRHSKLTSLAERDVNAFRIQNFAGHKSIKSTMQYMHLASRQSEGLSGD